MKALRSHTEGEGPALLLLHGWGISGNIWESVQEKLKTFCKVTWVDLPGYGRSPNNIKSHYTLEALATELTPLIKQATVVLGWSLGGLIATQLATKYPQQVTKLILTATSAQFFSSEDWPHAMNAEILESFGSDLKHAYRETVLQFLSIQALGSDRARDEIRTLKQRVFRDGEPCYHALEQGLHILQTQSQREQIKAIQCPTLIIAGEKDRLAPLAACQAMQQSISGSRLHCIKGTSHAPFLSHLDEFADTIRQFIHE